MKLRFYRLLNILFGEKSKCHQKLSRYTNSMPTSRYCWVTDHHSLLNLDSHLNTAHLLQRLSQIATIYTVPRGISYMYVNDASHGVSYRLLYTILTAGLHTWLVWKVSVTSVLPVRTPAVVTDRWSTQRLAGAPRPSVHLQAAQRG